MSALAAIRPDSWELPLFLHVLSAMVLVGALVLALTSLAGAGRAGSGAALRLGYRSLLLASIPAWILMRVAAQWLADEEGVSDLDAAWINIGYSTSEGSLLFLIGATVCAGIAARRVRSEKGEGAGLALAASILIGITLLAYAFAIWAMATKPS